MPKTPEELEKWILQQMSDGAKRGGRDAMPLAVAIIDYVNKVSMPIQASTFYQAILYVIPTGDIQDALRIREKKQPERM